MSTTVTSPETITLIDPARLHPAPDNVRRSLGKLDELTRSIKGVGIVEPLLVTTHESLPDGDYLIVAGHRRHAAAIAAEVEHVPVIVRALTDAERIATAVVENVQREALNPVEEATAFLRLCELDFTIRRLARTVGRSEKHVRSRLALLELPDRAHDLIEAGRLTLADAEVLLAAKDRPEVIEEVLGDDATIHQGRIESAVRSATRRAEQAEARIALEAELVAAGIVVLDEGVTGTPLADLGIEEDAHRGETCHGVTIRSGYGGPQAIVVCTDRRRHTQRGGSEVKVDRSAVRTDPEQERTRERRRVAERRATFLAGTIGEPPAQAGQRGLRSAGAARPGQQQRLRTGLPVARHRVGHQPVGQHRLGRAAAGVRRRVRHEPAPGGRRHRRRHRRGPHRCARRLRRERHRPPRLPGRAGLRARPVRDGRDRGRSAQRGRTSVGRLTHHCQSFCTILAH